MFPFLADFQSGSLSRPLLDGRLCILNASLGTWCSLPECQKYLCFPFNLFTALHPFALVRSTVWSAAAFLYASLTLFVFRFSQQCFPHTTVSVWLAVSQLSLQLGLSRSSSSIVSPLATCTRQWHLVIWILQLEGSLFFRLAECQNGPCRFYPAAFVSPVKIVPVV